MIQAPKLLFTGFSLLNQTTFNFFCSRVTFCKVKWLIFMLSDVLNLSFACCSEASMHSMLAPVVVLRVHIYTFFEFLRAMDLLQAGQTIHVGGLMRLDLNQASVQTIYVTVWASPNVSLHMGKMENADEFWKNHIGVRLQVKLCILQ